MYRPPTGGVLIDYHTFSARLPVLILPLSFPWPFRRLPLSAAPTWASRAC